jgi:DNA (cytosine-5)-methyltransferase 1
MQLTHGSLFSGIGGFDLAADFLGIENKFHCEWNPFGQKILKYYFPKSESFTDITTSDFSKYANTIDILSGGFPCQPYSLNGKRKGKNDERHLWPAMFRTIQQVEPVFVVGENVFGLVNWSNGLVFEEIIFEMESIGYEVLPVLLPACSVGAPHKRDRIFIIAYNERFRKKRNIEQNDSIDLDTNANGFGLSRRATPGNLEKEGKVGKEFFERLRGGDFWEGFPTESVVRSRNDGVPEKLDGISVSKWQHESIKGFGNAIVPQIGIRIFDTIINFLNYEQQQL